MTEKTLKKMMHYLKSNADYDNIQFIIDYIEDKEKKQGITLEEWKLIFEIFCSGRRIELQRWILENKIKILHLDDDAIRYVMLLTKGFTPELNRARVMAENMGLLYEYAPVELKREFLGTAFVICCGYNNIYMVKYLLELGVDCTFRFQGMTGLEIAQKYAESMEGYGDDTVYQYILRNQNRDNELEDVLKYYVSKRNFLDMEYFVYETEATICKEEDRSKLDSKLCRLIAQQNAVDYGYEHLFDDDTSAKTFMEFLDYYNWDDGLEIPYYIAMHSNCDLAVALRLFYEGEGHLKFWDKNFYDSYGTKHVEWKFFVDTMEERIKKGCYEIKELSYRVPLSDESRDNLKKQGLAEVFLTDIDAK